MLDTEVQAPGLDSRLVRPALLQVVEDG